MKKWYTLLFRIFSFSSLKESPRNPISFLYNKPFAQCRKGIDEVPPSQRTPSKVVGQILTLFLLGGGGGAESILRGINVPRKR